MRSEKTSSLSTGAIAASCGVNRATVLRWIKRGKLAAYVTPGGHHRVLVETLSAFLTNMGLHAEGGVLVDDSQSQPALRGKARE